MVIYLSYFCPVVVNTWLWLRKIKKNLQNSKLLENTCLFWRSILVILFQKNFNFSAQKRRSLEILFVYMKICFIFYLFILLFCRCLFKAYNSVALFCLIFLFRRHDQKWSSLFFLTHKLLILYVYEVASIFVYTGLREKRISWGAEIRGAYSDEKSLSFRVACLTWPTRFAETFGGYGIEIFILLQF